MYNILIINGPNLNLLGEREKDKYGKISLKDIEKDCVNFSKLNNINLSFFQSNIEGEIVDEIQNSRENQDCLIINAGGYTHTSVDSRCFKNIIFSNNRIAYNKYL